MKNIGEKKKVLPLAEHWCFEVESEREHQKQQKQDYNNIELNRITEKKKSAQFFWRPLSPNDPVQTGC